MSMSNPDPTDAEAQRQRDEINLFAAMALGGATAFGGYLQDDESDRIHRKATSSNESDGAAGNDREHNDDDDNDDGRRQSHSDISATQSNADRTAATTITTNSHGYTKPKVNMAPSSSVSASLASTATSNITSDGSTPTVSNKKPISSHRRRDSRGTNPTLGSSSSSPPPASTSLSPPSTFNFLDAISGGQDSNTFASHAAASSSAESGTFQFSKPDSNRTNVAEQSNLAAAAAALAASDDDDEADKLAGSHAPYVTGGSSSVIMPPHLEHAAAQAQAAATAAQTEDAPMFAEQVILERPLFFGPIVPPRVWQEARMMMETAMKELGLDPLVDPVPPLRDLPDAVRNVVGALRTYGYGLADVLLLSDRSHPAVQAMLESANGDPEDEGDDNDEGSDYHHERSKSSKEYWRGSPHISTYQPVWGEAIRAERIRDFRKRFRPQHVSRRASTAPPRLGGGGSPSAGLDLAESSSSTLHATAGKSAFLAASHHLGADGSTSEAGGSGRPSSAIRNTFSFPGVEAGQSTAEGSKSGGTATTFATSTASSASLVRDAKTTGSHSNGGGAGSTLPPSRRTENEQFGMWLRGGDDETGVLSMDDVGSVRSMDDMHRLNGGGSESPLFGDEIVHAADGENKNNVEPQPLSEQEIFSKWARGGDHGTFSFHGNAENPTDTFNFKPIVNFDPSTFQRLPSPKPVDSDDDSLIDDENKKQVGLNDHLSKAIASLLNHGNHSDDIASLEEESKVILAQAPSSDSKARPLNNYELTNGCVPLFGVDDAPLPVESDLGVHETKEEQQRCNDVKRSQDIIEKFVGPNVFGPIACPNPALHPDDFHSWNSRAISTHRSNSGMSIQTFPKSPQLHQSKSKDSSSIASSSAQQNQKKNAKRYVSKSRYGWWNVTEEKSSDDKPEESASAQPLKDRPKGSSKQQQSDMQLPKQLPPIHHSSSVLQVVTMLEPNPSDLREANLPLSSLHAAFSVGQCLPYLSDRPPSYRYIQIDTQAVGFPPIGCEVEPLFCSLALYNVETLSSSAAGDPGAAPLPDLQRCGRVTEALHFDVISDQALAYRCKGSLWPYSRSVLLQDQVAERHLQGTRCGVFPIPSGLNVANLYAVLMVRKVLAEESDFEPYLKAGTTSVDVEKLKSRAEKNSGRYGQFLVPFAFGVAPLLQVFGTDNPIIASSRAVQIPLFKFQGGERSIIDHIMVMLYPR